MSTVMTAQALARELGRSEKMLWSGVPRQGLLFRVGDAFLIPFSLLWTGFSVFWEHAAIANHAQPFFILWGVPFLLVGAYLIIGRFFLDMYQRARTYYAVTDERIIIVTGLVSREVKSLSLRTLAEITLREKADGIGTVTFGPVDPRYAMWAWSTPGWPGLSRRLTPSFELIPNVRSVYDTIREAQASAIGTGSKDFRI
jgi:hypothetical protein